MTTLGGILLGFGAAFLQSLSYILSRLFVGKFPGSTVKLLVCSHLIMGGFYLMTLMAVWPDSMPPIKVYGLSVVATGFFYLCGQICLFLALRESDASRVSPLLDVKILFLAMIAVLLLGERFSGTQLTSFVLCVCAAGMLSWSRGRFVWQSLAWVMMTCLGYSFSDACVKQVIDQFLYLGLLHGSLISAALCYGFCGIIGAALMALGHRVSREMWIYALPFAVDWFVAMLLLFSCFASIGIIFGNIIKATSRVISVFLGILIAAAGLVHLEEKMTGTLLMRKLGAAIFMVGAIALYYLD